MKRAEYHAELEKLCYMYSRNQRGNLTCWTKGYKTSDHYAVDAFRVRTKSAFVAEGFYKENGLSFYEMTEPEFEGDDDEQG